MNPRYTPLQSWERAALNRYVLQNGFPSLSAAAFWHTYGALLRGTSTNQKVMRSHIAHAVTHRQCRMAPLSTSAKLENRLVSLFAE